MLQDRKHRGPVRTGPVIKYRGPWRDTGRIRLIVIHDAEGENAAAIAQWGASGQRNASWHCLVDEREVIRQVPDHIVAWTAPGTNYDGLELEICGWAKWNKKLWFLHQATLKRAAWQCARWCVAYHVPPVWLTDRQLRDNVSEGFVTHNQASNVFGGTHWDPGPGFPKGYFMTLVKRRVKWLKEGK